MSVCACVCAYGREEEGRREEGEEKGEGDSTCQDEKEVMHPQNPTPRPM